MTAVAQTEAERYLLRETYAAHQIFMNVGYDASEIFVGISAGFGEAVSGEEVGGRTCWFVRLDHGGLSFTLLIAPVTEEEGERFALVWDEFARRGKRAATVAELDALLYGSNAYRRHVELLHGMMRKGLSVRSVGVFQ